jgi:RHS repeat-associated protein
METTLIRQRTGRLRKGVFTHNDRSELTSATMGDKAFAYDYDNIGNRKTAQEEANDFTYTANALNQYTEITENEVPFTPTFDADGNQTRIKTTTGIWEAVYNALNRPLTFTRENADGTMTVITADYDYMGRRVFKKVETVATDSETGEETRTVVSNHRFLYRGYLQIDTLDLTRTTLNDLWFITWDPTEPIATRPLAIQQSGTWYTYGLDLPKNVTELYNTAGGIATAYTYSPYGLVTSTGSVTQPIQMSSEFDDTETSLIYYNYRYYNPLAGRWLSYDIIETKIKQNSYKYAGNTPISLIDLVGGLSSDPLNPAWTDPSIYPSCNSHSSSEISGGTVAVARSLSGGTVAVARSLNQTGNLREEYTRRSSQIPTDISKEAQSDMRSNLKAEIRGRSNSFARSCLNEIDRKRNLENAKARSQGQPSPYRQDHAQSTNKDVNKFGKCCKCAGKVCFVASVVVEGYNIANAPEGEKLKETTRAASRMGGGLVGGATAGAALGALGANPAAVLVGTVLGGIAGAIGGEKAVDWMWSWFD